jgi:sulfite exporter TauE/SafE
VTLVVAVFVASLLGSVHCAAMCGAFACVYKSKERTTATAHAAYHGGRLASYLTLGVIAGALGRRVDDVALVGGIGRGAAIVGGVIMVAWAATRLAAVFGSRVPSAPAWTTRVIGSLLRRVPATSPVSRGAVMGLITTLIPCGWLYAFTATAATTASPVMGAVVMAVFWLGTVPALLTVALGAQRLVGASRQRLVTASTIAVLVIGLLAIAGRLQPLGMEHVHAETPHAR